MRDLRRECRRVADDLRSFGAEMQSMTEALLLPITSAVRKWSQRGNSLALRCRQMHAMYKQVSHSSQTSLNALARSTDMSLVPRKQQFFCIGAR